MKRSMFVIGLVAALCAGCGSLFGPGDDVCLTYAAPGIVLTVRDSVSGAPLAGAGTRIMAREGAYVDSARMYGDVPVETVGLAEERAGTYEVSVERTGYRSWHRAGVRVTADECHVRTVSLTARLQRLP